MDQYLITVKCLKKIYCCLEEIGDLLGWCIVGVATRVEGTNAGPVLGPFMFPFRRSVVDNGETYIKTSYRKSRPGH